MYIRIIGVIFISLILPGCSDNNRTNEIDAQVAVQFRTAMNINDISTLVNNIQLPFTMTEQQWDSADDGIGYILGARKVTRIESKQQLVPFLQTIVPLISIDGEQGHFISVSEYDDLKIELADSVEEWRNLKTYLFKRGEADVEHIILLGIQARSHKIKAIYMN